MGAQANLFILMKPEEVYDIVKSSVEGRLPDLVILSACMAIDFRPVTWG